MQYVTNKYATPQGECERHSRTSAHTEKKSSERPRGYADKSERSEDTSCVGDVPNTIVGYIYVHDNHWHRSQNSSIQ